MKFRYSEAEAIYVLWNCIHQSLIDRKCHANTATEKLCRNRDDKANSTLVAISPSADKYRVSNVRAHLEIL